MKNLITPKKELELYIETGRQKVVEVLFKYPDKEFSLTDLAKEAGVRKSNIGTILSDLSKIGFVEIVKLSKIWRIKACQSNPSFKRNKIVYNLSRIYQSGLVDFLVDYFHNPKSIILFGSFSKGEDISTSDIDIAIDISSGDQDLPKMLGHKILEIEELFPFKRIMDRKIQIHSFDRKSVDLGFFNNVANGIMLFGYLEVKP